MDWLSQFDFFLLDLDGLLVDTERLHCAAYRELAKRHGYLVPWGFEEYLQLAHSSSEGLKQEIFPHLTTDKEWEELYREKKEIYLSLLQREQVELMPGVKEFLDELFRLGKRRAVVTNSPLVQVDAIRRGLPILDQIPHWVTREDYDRPKPAPDGYLEAIRLYGKEGDEIVGLEDSLKGKEALEAAGVTALLICTPGRFVTESFQTIPQVRM